MRNAHPWKLPLTVLGGVIACLLSLAFVQKAFAADPPTRATPVARQAVSGETPWTGCGVGGHGAFMVGAVDFGPPVKPAADGMAFGLDALCDWQTGSAVIGVAANYSWLNGDLKTIGAKAEWGASVRAGYLIWPSALVYAKGGWSRIETSAGDVDGYKLGGGVELKLRDAPIFVSLEAMRGFYSDVLGSTLDADTTTVITRATYKFNWKN